MGRRSGRGDCGAGSARLLGWTAVAVLARLRNCSERKYPCNTDPVVALPFFIVGLTHFQSPRRSCARPQGIFKFLPWRPRVKDADGKKYNVLLAREPATRRRRGR
jgi:hypothetical protein